MKNNYTIHIPTPCHENWDAMTPVEQGRFCQSCAKEVVDFSLMTDNEVLNYFSRSTGNTCGRFNNDQLQRPLQPTKIKKKKVWWVAAMMPLLMLVEKVIAQKGKVAKNVIKTNESVMGLTGDVVITKVHPPTDYWPVSSDDETDSNPPAEKMCKTKATELTVMRKKGAADFAVAGTVVNSRFDEPLAYATVSIKDTRTAVVTDSAGNFSIKGSTPNSQAVLNISSVGFESTDVLVQIKDTIAKQEESKYVITGIIVDAADGKPLPSVTVILKGSKTGAASNDEGVFKLSTTTQSKSIALAISYVGYKNAEIIVPLNNAVVTIDTVRLERVEASEITAGIIVCSYTKPKRVDTIPTFIRKVFHTEAFKVYPNPAQSGNHVTVDVKTKGSYSIQLYSSRGNLIMAEPVEVVKGATQITITIPTGLTPGMYYIRLFDNKRKKQYTDKLIIL